MAGKVQTLPAGSKHGPYGHGLTTVSQQHGPVPHCPCQRQCSGIGPPSVKRKSRNMSTGNRPQKTV